VPLASKDETMTITEALLIFGMFAVTFGVRYPLLVLVGRVHLPPTVIRGLRFVPVAVLTAICVPAVLLPAGTLDLRPTNAYLIAALAAILIAWRTKHLLLTIGAGMGIFLLWRVLFPL
jgi:branched-subunit amino acid transport protein